MDDLGGGGHYLQHVTTEGDNIVELVDELNAVYKGVAA